MIITGIGDCGVDVFTDHDVVVPGGTTLNFTVNIKKILNSQAEVRVFSAIGDDEYGKLVLDEIDKNNLRSFLQVKKGKTSIQYIDHSYSGEKKFVKYKAGVLKKFTINKKDMKYIQESDSVLTVLYKQIEYLFNSVITCKPKGLMMVDFMDLSDYSKSSQIVEKYINHLDVAIFGLKKEDIKLINELKKLAAKYEKLFILTLGEHGSLAFKGATSYKQEAVRVKNVVDTTGAGDAFAAGFVSEYLFSRSIPKSLKSGSILASKIVQKVGT